MSWRNREDLGTKIVGLIHDTLKMTDQWIVDLPRGFRYWASDYALTITADHGNFHNAFTIFRIHSEIEVAKGKGHPEELEGPISDLMQRAALSALGYDAERDTYSLSCSVYAHHDNEAWLVRLLIAAVGLQISKAPAMASELQSLVKLSPAISGHPKHGLRSQPDASCGNINRFFKPYGAQPSRWVGIAEWHDATRNLQRVALDVVSDEKSEIVAQMPWIPGKPIVLTVSATRPHPDFGNGLAFSLDVPWESTADLRAHTAMALNEMERREWNWCHDLGSWCVVGDVLSFHCFVPNVAFSPDILTELTHDMAIRSKWVNEHAALQVMGVSDSYLH